MPLITLQSVEYGVGGPPLLDAVDLAIEANERIALIGRNGAGKSTLLRLLAGEIVPDDGTIHRESGLRVAALAQEVPQDTGGSVFDVVAGGLGEAGELLRAFHAAAHVGDAQAMGALQTRIEQAGAWHLERRVGEVLERLALDGDADFAALSGGMKRRVLLARALVSQPQLLLLDEPTNHLDIEAIDWLEGFLTSFGGSVVFVTHDRRFLRALATRIVEIERGQVTSWPGDWNEYRRRQDERLNAEAAENARFDKLLSQEEAWIRQGIKARRTRDEGRVRRLKAMRMERAQRRERQGNVKMEVAEAARSGRKVIETIDLGFAFDDRPIVQGLSTVVMRGDRVGLIGANGSGKTTLLRLLLGELAPQQGEVRLGTGIELAYFDQYRAVLREDWNALDNVAEGREFIEINGRRKHVIGYLQDFLFSPERARAAISRLSGGERNRLLLARLFSRPSNLLVLDEPTNDLDAETLELLEEQLAEYPGTVLLVSHDRDFLDAVVTSTLVMEGEGRVGEYVGGYSDWIRQGGNRGQSASSRRAEAKPDEKANERPDTRTEPLAPEPAKRKLSYKDARELEQLPARIETLESQVAALTACMSDPGFYQREAAAIAADGERLAGLQRELESAYARWEALEG
jgi:ABC transport system ATP-binding/permease protein